MVELTGDMVRCHNAGIFLEMACVAIRCEVLVHFVLMAFRTVGFDMCAGESEVRLVVIEDGGLPDRCGMACETIVRELSLIVIGSDELIDVRLVARVALL